MWDTSIYFHHSSPALPIPQFYNCISFYKRFIRFIGKFLAWLAISTPLGMEPLTFPSVASDLTTTTPMLPKTQCAWSSWTFHCYHQQCFLLNWKLDVGWVSVKTLLSIGQLFLITPTYMYYYIEVYKSSCALWQQLWHLFLIIDIINNL